MLLLCISLGKAIVLLNNLDILPDFKYPSIKQYKQYIVQCTIGHSA